MIALRFLTVILISVFSLDARGEEKRVGYIHLDSVIQLIPEYREAIRVLDSVVHKYQDSLEILSGQLVHKQYCNIGQVSQKPDSSEIYRMQLVWNQLTALEFRALLAIETLRDNLMKNVYAAIRCEFEFFCLKYGLNALFDAGEMYYYDPSIKNYTAEFAQYERLRK